MTSFMMFPDEIPPSPCKKCDHKDEEKTIFGKDILIDLCAKCESRLSYLDSINHALDSADLYSFEGFKYPSSGYKTQTKIPRALDINEFEDEISIAEIASLPTIPVPPTKNNSNNNWFFFPSRNPGEVESGNFRIESCNRIKRGVKEWIEREITR